MFETSAQELMYPELNVVPKATERVRIEAVGEARGVVMEYLPLITPGLMLIGAGAMGSGNLKDDKEESYAPAVAIGVGAVTVLATTWAAMQYRPYKKMYLKLKKFPARSLREKLKRERLAEEEINHLSSIGFKTRLTIAVANLAASSYLLESMDDKSDDGKKARSITNIAQALSLVPLFFPMRWEKVASEQEKYKKKIYAPVAYAPILNHGNQAAVGANLFWRF